MPIVQAASGVKTKHEALIAAEPAYDRIADCIAGEDVVKAKGDKYLPRLNRDTANKDAQERYEDYKLRAVFFNVTARTLNALRGQVFAKPPQIDLPTALEYLKLNATGDGITLSQFLALVLNSTLAFGRAGVFVDFPAVDGPITKADVEKGVRPHLRCYEAREVRNWRVNRVGNIDVTTLIVLRDREQDDKEGDIFYTKETCYYRVARLVGEKVYYSEYNDAGVIRLEAKVLNGGDGNPLTRIPFEFVGAENNDAKLDPAPLAGIASLNLAHYRNSADYEESVFLLGQPMFVFTGIMQQWLDNVLKGIIKIGARVGIPLNKGADAKLLQAQPNTLAYEAMTQKERQMVALGARLIEQKNVERTATEVSDEAITTSSLLTTVAVNVGTAVTRAIGYAAGYLLDVDSNAVKVTLNTEYDRLAFTAEMQRQLRENFVAGLISFPEARKVLMRQGFPLDDDDAALKRILADLEKLGQATTPAAPTGSAPVA